MLFNILLPKPLHISIIVCSTEIMRNSILMVILTKYLIIILKI